MYLVAASPETTPMSPGKLAAQAAHAAVLAYEATPDNNTKRVWWRGGHYTKIVLMADDLAVAQAYIEDRGFKCERVIDEGRTEFDGKMTPTFLGVQIVDKDDAHVKATFGEFKLYREPATAETSRRFWKRK